MKFSFPFVITWRVYLLLEGLSEIQMAKYNMSKIIVWLFFEYKVQMNWYTFKNASIK